MSEPLLQVNHLDVAYRHTASLDLDSDGGNGSVPDPRALKQISFRKAIAWAWWGNRAAASLRWAGP